MKKIVTKCPKCGWRMIYRNYWDWILHTPFHWFGKRKVKCLYCHFYYYAKGERVE